METMRALVYQGPGKLEMETRNKPAPGPGQVRVKIDSASICGSDLGAYKSLSDRFAPPLVLGHEFSGTIDAVGAGVTRVTVGQTVTANPILYCGECWYCKNGMINLCSHRTSVGTSVGVGKCDGAFTEYLYLPDFSIIPLIDGVSMRDGALMEPLAVGIHAAKLGGFQKGETTAVIGTGPIGLLTIMCLKALGAGKIICTDINDKRLSLAKDLGADVIINSANEDAVERVKAESDGRGADRVIICTGAASTFNPSIYMTRSGGSVIVVGLIRNQVDLNPMDFFARGINIYGSYMYTNEMFEAMEMVASGKIVLDKLVTSTYALQDAQKAFDILVSAENEEIKVIIKA